VTLTDKEKHQSYEETMTNSNKVEQVKAMQEEIKSLH